MQLALSILLSILAKLATQELIQFVVIRLLQEGAKRTQTVIDDEILAKIAEILERK